MANGTIEFTQSMSSGSYIDGKIVWESASNVSTNMSSVTASIYVKKGSTTTTLTIPTEGTWTYTLSINGTNFSGALSRSVLRDWVLLSTHTVVSIAHTIDGSKSISISGTITAPSATSFKSHTTTGSATVVLDTIARPTTIDSLTCNTSYVDGTITALYTPKSSGFYNQRIVYVNVENTLTHIHTRNLGQSTASQQTHTLQFDEDELSLIYSKVKNTATATIRVTFRTYSDSGYSTKVGSDQSREIALSIPLSVWPEANLEITPINSNDWIASKDIYVAGLSGVNVALSATPGEGASHVVHRNRLTYDGRNYDNVTGLKVNTLKKSGSIRFTASVTDSRNRSATVTEDITVLPYSAPTIYSVKIERGKYESDWTADDNGSDVRVYFITSLALADHTNTYNVAFTLDGTTITPDAGNPEGLRSGIDYAFHFLNVDSEHSHSLMISATDLVGERGAVTAIIPTTQVTVDFKANGKGIAFGKASEKDAFECAMDAEFTGDVKIGGKSVDVVIEEGEKDFWTYRKWSSGLLECWGITTAVTLSFDGTAGLGCWYGTTAPEFNFPTNANGESMFIDIPTVNQTCDAGSAIIVSSITHVDSKIVKITYGRFYGGNDNKEVEFHFFAKGRWK